jgi:HlyD family secretion protein
MQQYVMGQAPAIAQTQAIGIHARLTDFRRIARMGYAAILLSFGGFGTWAATAPLDSAAVASASVAVTSDRKPVQHLEGGIVKEVLVAENQKVKAGQVLFRLQPIQAQSNADILRKQLEGTLAQEARLLAEREMRPRITFPQSLVERRLEPEMASIIADQEKQFTERKRGLEGQIDIFKRRIDQTNSDIEGKQQRETALKMQLANLKTEIGAVSSLADKGFYPRNKMLALQRDLFRMQGDLGQLQSDIQRSREMNEESKVQIRMTVQKQVEEASQMLGDVRARLADLREKLQVAADVLSRVEVRAPQDGVLQGLKVQGVGAVVRPGEPMAEIITIDDGLIMTARVQPTDIDSVVPGQKAEIRFPAFASRQKKATLGQVDSISADAVFDPNTKQTYYNARVSIDLATLPPELRAKLTPGMPATVLITTGERTVLKFIVGPLFDAVARTMRER